MLREWRRALYGSTIFTGALLLFLVQPMIARAILPWYGGSAGVWTTSMLFFQALLLAGYWYAHRTGGLERRIQAGLHAALLTASLALLPVIPSARWKPAGASDPVAGILVLLAVTVGLPYFLLSATSPLVQSWYAREGGRSPYRLFAVSNFASLAALLAYPVFVEPAFPLRTQLWIWSGAYAAFAVLCGASALAGMAYRKPVPKQHGGHGPTALLWLALAACPCALWLAAANQISQVVAPIPFIWILPLSLYLLSLILCFERDGWYRPRLYRFLAPAGVVALGAGSAVQWTWPLKWTLLLISSGLFFCCMFCHGELARRKPPSERLTSFYLMVSMGGALGGFFVAVAAPRLLDSYLELQIFLAVCLFLIAGLLFGYTRLAHVPHFALVIVLGVGVGLWLRGSIAGRVLRARNFYGVLEVADGKGPHALRTLYHGAIIHGSQYLAPERSRVVTSYYGPSSGVALALQRGAAQPRRVGIVGLGAGVLAAYGRAGDLYRFYEINPMVIEVARRYFRYLEESPARTEIVLGDARLVLENEPPQNFDTIVVDAFSGDSVPVHLLTREAFAVYFRHLKPDGVLVVHVTNRYVHLAPVVRTVAGTFGRATHVVRSHGNGGAIYGAEWALITADPEFAKAAAAVADPTPYARPVPVWTDDYSNVFRLLR